MTGMCEEISTSATPRVARLRDRAAAAVREAGECGGEETAYLAARAWRDSAGEHSHLVRRGLLAGGILRRLTPVIDDDELLVGKFAPCPLSAEEAARLEQWKCDGIAAELYPPGQKAHMAIDYPRLLHDGVAGIREQIGRHRARLDLARPDEQARDEFYRGCLAALDGMVALAQRYTGLADEQAARAASPERAAELREVARICRKVPEYPAETFHEAVQAVHFVTFCLCAGNLTRLFQPGRPDRYLLPFYRRDLAEGRLTRARAQELLDCLGILLNVYTPRGLAAGWMVGGRDEDGCDVTNELSYLCVQTVGHVRLAYPGVGICWTPDTPPALLALASRLLAEGCSHPAIFNDEVISRGLRQAGLSRRDACQYIHSTCVEITPVAISNAYVASPYYNLVQCLHDVLGMPAAGGAVGPLPDIVSFDDLLARYRQRLREAVTVGVAGINAEMRARHEYGGFPLLSCFVNDCLAAGWDIDHGGARVNWIESSFVGLANLVDALAAIRLHVFETGAVSLARLREALLADCQGYDDVRALLARAPKYGNDDDAADLLAGEVTSMIRDECARHRSYWGDAVLPGFFCWQMHEVLGRETAASADGRPAGFPFADGSGAAQGRERHGPTAAIRSVTKWEHAPMLGGIAVNMRFHSGRDAAALAAPLRAVLETFLRLGGFEVQVNVVDTATLRRAQSAPEQYRDLVVRVAGYSDYFTALSPEMQEEIIARAELTL